MFLNFSSFCWLASVIILGDVYVFKNNHIDPLLSQKKQNTNVQEYVELFQRFEKQPLHYSQVKVLTNQSNILGERAGRNSKSRTLLWQVKVRREGQEQREQQRAV